MAKRDNGLMHLSFHRTAGSAIKVGLVWSLCLGLICLTASILVYWAASLAGYCDYAKTDLLVFILACFSFLSAIILTGSGGNAQLRLMVLVVPVLFNLFFLLVMVYLNPRFGFMCAGQVWLCLLAEMLAVSAFIMCWLRCGTAILIVSFAALGVLVLPAVKFDVQAPGSGRSISSYVSSATARLSVNSLVWARFQSMCANGCARSDCPAQGDDSKAAPQDLGIGGDCGYQYLSRYTASFRFIFAFWVFVFIGCAIVAFRKSINRRHLLGI